ncbi:MAG: 4Fe-4S binding protein [Candidatus Zixiibacteriota bacterium]|nr:MAG: 4Fe-4S binding protein [candidate division Zixibacteria bacterium]
MTIKAVRNLRRISQIIFFGIFFWLILKTTFEVNFNPADPSEIRLPYPVSIALEFDPLVALGTILSSGTLYKGLLWSLVILIPTIFFGRFFCGWVCPMGTLNHWVSEIPSERLRRKGVGKIRSNRYMKYQRIKYYVLLVFLGAAFLGSLQIGLLDPLALLARSIGTVVLPMLHTAANGTLEWVKGLGLPALASGAQSVYDTVAPLLLTYKQSFFHTILTIGTLFLIILALNRLFTRFWCRGICPLGALLAIFSRFSFLGLQKEEASCKHCQLCSLSCQGADDPEIGRKWRQAECHLCLNCQASCPEACLSFRLFPNQEVTPANPAGTPQINITRRKAALSVGSGLLLFPLFRSGDAFAVNANPRLIRPPGSLPEEEFTARCIRCGQCMRVCPNNALHPTLLEAGLESMWSPILIAKIGYCEPTCTLCGQVCPTGAIMELSLQEKVGDKETPPNRIGTAFIDQGRCLPWAMATPCIVCEEWCPTSPKAVYLKEETVFDSKGNPVAVKRPYVDPHLCTGCGACEYACPISDRAAIYITSAGETRSVENQFLLEKNRKKAPAPRSTTQQSARN